jgi:hypothetical protein
MYHTKYLKPTQYINNRTCKDNTLLDKIIHSLYICKCQFSINLIFFQGSFGQVLVHVSNPMFRMFRKPVSVLDEENNKLIMRFRIMFQIHLKEMRPWSVLVCVVYAQFSLKG